MWPSRCGCTHVGAPPLLQRRDCHAALAMTEWVLFDKLRALTLVCHCEERSDVAISMKLYTRRRTAVASATRLPRCARNDKQGAHEAQGERGNVFG